LTHGAVGPSPSRHPRRITSRRPPQWPTDEELTQYVESVQERESPHNQTFDLELPSLGTSPSRSSVAMLEPREQEAVLGRLTGLWENDPELQGHESRFAGLSHPRPALFWPQGLPAWLIGRPE